jgi:hypothetical protein
VANLLAQHLEVLRARGVPDAVIAETGYCSATTKAELHRRGFSAGQAAQVPSLVIPLHDVRGEIRNYQIRPDTRRVLDGKPVKYETVKGSKSGSAEIQRRGIRETPSA